MAEQHALLIVAPNGARITKETHSQVPLCPQEMADDVQACVAAGAAMVHVHARDAMGAHSLAVDDNDTMMSAVRERIGDAAIIQLTTEAVGRYQPVEQMQLIYELVPEAASFSVRELVPNERTEEAAATFFQWCYSQNIIAQYILYSSEDLRRYFDLLARGVIPSGRHHVLLVLGRYSQHLQSMPTDLLPLLSPDLLDSSLRWAVCAFGRQEHRCLSTALSLGGDIRVGFENNIYRPDGSLAQNNAEQVRRIADYAHALGRPLCSAATIRTQLSSI